jgi:hypothetical protein
MGDYLQSVAHVSVAFRPRCRSIVARPEGTRSEIEERHPTSQGLVGGTFSRFLVLYKFGVCLTISRTLSIQCSVWDVSYRCKYDLLTVRVVGEGVLLC